MDRPRPAHAVHLLVARLYSESVDSAPQSAAVHPVAISSAAEVRDIDDLWRAAEADSVGLGKDELATVLLAIGDKYNYAQPSGVAATRAQIRTFWQSLQLHDLALAHACALGRDI